MKIGFIGLGNMGGPMAANLAQAGHVVTGFDMAEVAAEGVTMTSSAAEAATGADVVITMLPTVRFCEQWPIRSSLPWPRVQH